MYQEAYHINTAASSIFVGEKNCPVLHISLKHHNLSTRLYGFIFQIRVGSIFVDNQQEKLKFDIAVRCLRKWWAMETAA
jgi:hypothetical protein